MSTLLPQLPDSSALPLMAEMSLCSDPSSLEPGSELRSSQAYVMPTGGLPVQEATLKQLRDKIVEAALHHGFPEKRPRSFLAFELQVAKILAVWDPLWIHGVPSGESLRNGCWTFLTVIVLPDVALWRWPASTEGETDKAWKGRMLGGGRNAFQRIYRRVISLDRGPSHPDRWGLIRELREDDFSNILERPSLGSNPNVAVCLAEEYLAMRERLSSASAEIQTHVYREATKDLRSYGVVQALDMLPRADLENLIHQTFLRREKMYLPKILGPSSPDSPDPEERTEPGSVEAYPQLRSDSSVEQGESAPTSSPQNGRPPGLLRRLLGGG
jgi:hypothetical protein